MHIGLLNIKHILEQKLLPMFNFCILLQVVQKLRTTFLSGKTRPVEFRKQQLQNLYKLLTENKNELIGALREDLCKVGEQRDQRSPKPKWSINGAMLLTEVYMDLVICNDQKTNCTKFVKYKSS